MTRLVETAGDFALSASHGMAVAHYLDVNFHAKLKGLAESWRQAAGGLGYTLDSSIGSIAGSLVSLSQGITDGGLARNPMLNTFSGMDPANIHEFMSNSLLSDLSNAGMLNEQDALKATRLAELFANTFPELMPSAALMDVQAGKLSPDGARALLKRFEQLSHHVPRLPDSLQLPEQAKQAVDRVFESTGLIRMAQGHSVDPDQRQEALASAKSMLESKLEQFDAADRAEIQEGRISRETAQRVVHHAATVRYPYQPELFDFLSTFLVDGNQVVSVAITPSHWDATEPAYRAVRHCLAERYGKESFSPYSAAISQAILQGGAVTRTVTEGEKEQISQGFSLAMRHAPVLGGIATRYLLGYAPEYGYMAHYPSQHAIESAKSLIACVADTYSPLGVHKQNKSTVRLLAALSSSSEVEMNAYDETWTTLGNTVAVVGDITEDQWAEFDRALRLVE